ncbi:MAG TPA: hypothetical protein VMA73_01740 [Streptosporangiaceae bacterium]|nr:hypothetical protein [Streptosporangiaceae bacterium]
MLNFTPADQAAMRPLAGFGAGAFACEGAWVGSSASQLAAGPSLPRIRGAFAVAQPVHARTADAFGGAFRARSVGRGSAIIGGTLGAGLASTRNGSTKQHNQTTRIYPVIPGGVGPHPAREPDPV